MLPSTVECLELWNSVSCALAFPEFKYSTVEKFDPTWYNSPGGEGWGLQAGGWEGICSNCCIWPYHVVIVEACRERRDRWNYITSLAEICTCCCCSRHVMCENCTQHPLCMRIWGKENQFECWASEGLDSRVQLVKSGLQTLWFLFVVGGNTQLAWDD